MLKTWFQFKMQCISVLNTYWKHLSHRGRKHFSYAEQGQRGGRIWQWYDMEPAFNDIKGLECEIVKIMNFNFKAMFWIVTMMQI